MTTTVIKAQTTAIADKSPVYHANGSGEVSFTAVGLAGAETITPYVGGGATWQPIYDSAGVQVKLTATKPQLSLPASLPYAFDKDTTVAAVSLHAGRTYAY